MGKRKRGEDPVNRCVRGAHWQAEEARAQKQGRSKSPRQKKVSHCLGEGDEVPAARESRTVGCAEREQGLRQTPGLLPQRLRRGGPQARQEGPCWD